MRHSSPVATLHLFSRPRAPPPACAASSTLGALSDALPFIAEAALVAEDVEYSGLGVSIRGRADYCAAAASWKLRLPERLPNFACANKFILPPDARGMVSCRYQLSFDAPVPPAVLPGQRRRLAAARLPLTAGGRTRVTANVVGTLYLDEDSGRVRRYTEQLVGDPMAVGTSIAHFELLNARAVAREPTSGLPPPVREPYAYWQALRGMMRIELEEIRRRDRQLSDELAVLTDDSGVSDADFERAFRLYLLRIFLLGAAGPFFVFVVAKLGAAAAGSL